MHIKAPNTDTDTNMHYFRTMFSKSQEETTHNNSLREKTQIWKKLSELSTISYILYSVLYTNSLSHNYSTNSVFFFSMSSVFSAVAAVQWRNEGGLQASFASVSSVLRLVYWLVWLSCLIVFTCSFFPLQDDSQQSAAAQPTTRRSNVFVIICSSPTKIWDAIKQYPEMNEPQQ